jgi:hypothetical protein
LLCETSQPKLTVSALRDWKRTHAHMYLVRKPGLEQFSHKPKILRNNSSDRE